MIGLPSAWQGYVSAGEGEKSVRSKDRHKAPKRYTALQASKPTCRLSHFFPLEFREHEAGAQASFSKTVSATLAPS